MNTTRTHECPGRCGVRVPQHHLACKPCWGKLPRALRDEINAAWMWRRQSPDRHRRALLAALTWYRGQRATPGTTLPYPR